MTSVVVLTDIASADTGSWVVEPVLATTTAMQVALTEPDPEPLTLLVKVEPTTPDHILPLQAASIAALRGLMHSVTLESGAGLRVNMVVADEADAQGIADALALLESAAGEWIAGATLDLQGLR